MLTLPTIRTAAKAIAQDASSTGPTGVKLLLADPGDYNLAITQALRLFAKDRPNLRVVDQTLATAGFRQVLAGTGAWSGLTGTNAWAVGFSQITALYWPWSVANQGQLPLESDQYRVVKDPAATILEFLAATPAAGEVVRLVFTRRHAATESTPTSDTVQDDDLDLISLLAGSQILQLAAVKAAQNTGNTALPNDVVDRRSQADILASRSKDLMKQYQNLVGRGADVSVGPASGFRDLDIQAGHRRGFLWHPTAAR